MAPILWISFFSRGSISSRVKYNINITSPNKKVKLKELLAAVPACDAIESVDFFHMIPGNCLVLLS